MLESLRPILGAFAIFLQLFSYILYCRDIIRGKTKPHAFSWLIWAILAAVAFFGQRADFAGPGSWLNGFIAVAASLIFIFALLYCKQDITGFDCACLVFAIGSIGLWIVSHTPLWSMILITIIDSAGFVPTIRKSWRKPFDETLSTYLLSGINYFMSALALDNFTLITGLYPTVLVFMNAALVLELLKRRRALLDNHGLKPDCAR